MRFQRKDTSTYEKMYNKRDTIKMLKEHLIVAKVSNKLNKIIITTIPIKPKRMIFKSPVGTYKITLTGLPTLINIEIERVEGSVFCNTPNSYGDWIHNHWKVSWNKPCYGNINSELIEMKHKKDWYWLSRKLLDWIMDWSYEYIFYEYSWKKRMKIFQENYKEYHDGD